MHLYGLHSFPLVETHRANHWKSYWSCSRRYRIHRCGISGWFYQRPPPLGLWYLGRVYHSHRWAYINPKFQNAPCWSPRHHETQLHWDQRQYNLPHATIHRCRFVNLLVEFLYSMLLLDNCLWCDFRNFNQLNSQMGSHGTQKTSFYHQIPPIHQIDFKSWRTPQTSYWRVRHWLLHHQWMDEPDFIKNRLLEKIWKFHHKSYRCCPKTRW